jgi:hypothetical protein
MHRRQLQIDHYWLGKVKINANDIPKRSKMEILVITELLRLRYEAGWFENIRHQLRHSSETPGVFSATSPNNFLSTMSR